MPHVDPEVHGPAPSSGDRPLMGGTPLVVAKNLLFHVACLRNIERYLEVKGRLMLAAATLGAYERDYMRLLPSFVRPGAVVADVGANVGVYTHALARLAGPSGRVVAFEPIPPVATLLERSCATLPSVTVVREALSDGREASVNLNVPYLPGRVPEPALAHVASAEDDNTATTWRTFRVPARRLDDYIDQLHGVSFIKADVEGHEAAFLEGAAHTLRTFRPCVQLESGGIVRHRTAVMTWARTHDYVLLTLVGDRLVPATDTSALSLNVYLVPTEARSALAPAAIADVPRT